MTRTEVEKSNRGIGLKTIWRFCDCCDTTWTFDHMNDEEPVVHFSRKVGDWSLPVAICPDCEVEIFKKGAEVDYGDDD